MIFPCSRAFFKPLMYVVVSRLCGAGDGTQLKREANSVNNKLKIRVTIISKLVTYATGLGTLTILFRCLIFTLTVTRLT